MSKSPDAHTLNITQHPEITDEARTMLIDLAEGATAFSPSAGGEH